MNWRKSSLVNGFYPEAHVAEPGPYRANERPPGVRHELGEEGQLLFTFGAAGLGPIEPGTFVISTLSMSTMAEPVRLVVEESCAPHFYVVGLRLACAFLLSAGAPGTAFPALPAADANHRAPWRNLLRPRGEYGRHMIGAPGMTMQLEMRNTSDLPRDFYAMVYGRIHAGEIA